MNKFIEIDPQELTDNVFKLIGRDWMLITAGDERRCNTMTASWGGLGVLWNANVTFRATRWLDLFVRGENLLAQRYEINAGFRMPKATALGGMNVNF